MTLRALVTSLFLLATLAPPAMAAKVPLPPERPAGLNGDAGAAAPAIPATPPVASDGAVLPPKRPARLAPGEAAEPATADTPAAGTETDAAAVPPETETPVDPGAAETPDGTSEAEAPADPAATGAPAGTTATDAPADPADTQLVGAPPPVASETAETTRSVPLPPEKPGEIAARVAMAMPRAATGNGERMVCADPRLVGRQKPTVVGHIPGCMIGAPVEVLRIAGIRLSTPATLDCHTARTFANWVTGVADPSARKLLGGRITRIWVMGSYSCRTRNNRRGAKLSEHAAGRAVDIGGFTLGDGRKIRVESHWGKGDSGKFLRGIWKQACGSFKTVLGPEGDRFHRDHLHLDTAPRRSSYCR